MTVEIYERMPATKHMLECPHLRSVPISEEMVDFVRFILIDDALCRQWLRQMIARGMYWPVDVSDLTIHECHDAVWEVAEAVWAQNNREKLH